MSFLYFHILFNVKFWLVSLLHFFHGHATIIDEEKEGMVPDMSEEFGPDFITVTDEDGNEFELEHLDTLEYNGQTYMAFFPTVDDETDEAAAEDFGLVILKSVTENGEELLTTLDSDEELQRVYDLFMEQLMDEDDENS